MRARSAGDDAEVRRRRIHARRSLRTWTDRDGVWHLHAVNNPDVGARIMATVGTLRDRIFRSAPHRWPP